MNETSLSFWQAAWRRLKKNKAAMIGLFMIVVAIFIALFGYFLAPDPSPFANRIILEIGGEKPGFTQSFLLLKKTDASNTPLLKQAVSGKADLYDYIPVTQAQVTG